MASGNIFATVGTTQFDLFITTLTSSKILRILKNQGYSKLTMQIGNGTVVPKTGLIEGVHLDYFRFKDSIIEDISKADLVISHAGAGSCLEVLDAGKPLIVVVNEGLMDNHQLELAEQLFDDGHLYYCKCTDLENMIENLDLTRLKPFKKGNPNLFVNHLETMLGFQK